MICYFCCLKAAALVNGHIYDYAARSHFFEVLFFEYFGSLFTGNLYLISNIASGSGPLRTVLSI